MLDGLWQCIVQSNAKIECAERLVRSMPLDSNSFLTIMIQPYFQSDTIIVQNNLILFSKYPFMKGSFVSVQSCLQSENILEKNNLTPIAEENRTGNYLLNGTQYSNHY